MHTTQVFPSTNDRIAYQSGATSWLYRYRLDARLAWMLQEVPCVLWAVAAWPLPMPLPNRILVALFALHYIQR